MDQRNEASFGVHHIPSDEPPIRSSSHTSPATSSNPPSANSAHPILYPGLTWLLGLMIGVLALRYLVPHLAEEIQYSITRGQQRAKYEVAGEHLQHAGLNDLSLAY